MLKLVDIEVDRLTVGMYVAELDRPWLETPFLFQGFRLTEQDELDTLKRLCRRVRIDTTLGTYPPEAARARALSDQEVAQSNAIFRSPSVKAVAHRRPVEDELPRARKTYTALAGTFQTAMDELRTGGVLSIDRIQAASTPLVESISNNPDALTWLATLQRKDTGIYQHSMAVAILVSTYARHLGLPKPALQSMALGGLLFDVGKTRVPDVVLMKPDRLNEQEYQQFQKHVEYGVEILRNCQGTNDTVLLIVETHHERHDGSGYPHGLKGDAIPAYGKIVGIADVYQTMLQSPSAGRRLSPHEVLNYLNAQRDKLFDAALVEEFIQAIGIYPTGTFIKLSDGSVGVVYEQNRLRRLLPRVMVVLDSAGNRMKPFPIIDLLLQKSDLQIVECLEPGAYGLDPEELFL
ncbi:MAG: HD-GYP domain-containing protein [Steroidobacteraceae bacterium]